MRALSLFARKPRHPPENSPSLWLLIFCLYPFLLAASRAFGEILRQDRLAYGTGSDYEIENGVVDDWQQRVDNVISGAAAEYQ